MKIYFTRFHSILFIIILGIFACTKEETSQTGLEGIVFRGPINPVAIQGQVNDEPFSALFRVYNEQNTLIKSFHSNDDGEFSIKLEPGSYNIIPDQTAPIMSPEQQAKEITIQPVQVTRKDLYFDTGIR